MTLPFPNPRPRLTKNNKTIPSTVLHILGAVLALSVYLPLMKAEHDLTSKAKDDVEASIEYYRENRQTAEMLRAYDVWFALKAKQETSAAITGAVNGATYNVPKRLDAGHAIDNFEGANVASPQLQYMCSMYAIEMTNPGAYEAGEQVIGAIGNATTAKGVLEKIPRVVWPIIKETLKTIAGNHVADTINENAEDRY